MKQTVSPVHGISE